MSYWANMFSLLISLNFLRIELDQVFFFRLLKFEGVNVVLKSLTSLHKTSCKHHFDGMLPHPTGM